MKSKMFRCSSKGKAFLFLLLPLFIVVPSASGDSFVDPLTKHTYEVIEESLSWEEARRAAAGKGPGCHLATITSSREDDFVVSNLPTETDMWLGGRQKTNLDCDNGNDPSYWGVWVTGEPWSYTNWDTGEGEPDDCEEQCLAYGEDNPILWENAECEGTEEEEDEGMAAYLVECEPAASVPTLGQGGVLIISLCLLGIAVYRLRRGRLS